MEDATADVLCVLDVSSKTQSRYVLGIYKSHGVQASISAMQENIFPRHLILRDQQALLVYVNDEVRVFVVV